MIHLLLFTLSTLDRDGFNTWSGCILCLLGVASSTGHSGGHWYQCGLHTLSGGASQAAH